IFITTRDAAPAATNPRARVRTIGPAVRDAATVCLPPRPVLSASSGTLVAALGSTDCVAAAASTLLGSARTVATVGRTSDCAGAAVVGPTTRAPVCNDELIIGAVASGGCGSGLAACSLADIAAVTTAARFGLRARTLAFENDGLLSPGLVDIGALGAAV